MEIVPTADGAITVAQAAALAGVSEITVRSWTRQGYMNPSGQRVRLPVKRREGGRLLLDPVEVAKAEHATRKRARRLAAFPLPAAA